MTETLKSCSEMSSNVQILKYLWEDAKNHKNLKAKKNYGRLPRTNCCR